MTEEFADLPGGKLHAALWGDGPSTMVLLSGSAILIPALEYQSLAQAFSPEEHTVIVLSRYGYGKSDLTDALRDVDTVVEEYRSALEALGFPTPVALIGHSLGFFEALRWGQKYPEEISALIGLDPAVPEAYEHFNVSDTIQQYKRLNRPEWKRRLAFRMFSRTLLGRYGLSRAQQRHYKAAALQNFFSRVWINEADALTENRLTVDQAEVPASIPALFLLSNGRETPLSKEEWRGCALRYLEQFEIGQSKLYELPHDLYRYIPDRIASVITAFCADPSGPLSEEEEEMEEPDELEETECGELEEAEPSEEPDEEES